MANRPYFEAWRTPLALVPAAGLDYPGVLIVWFDRGRIVICRFERAGYSCAGPLRQPSREYWLENTIQVSDGGESMPKFHVERSITIDAPPEKVRAAVANFAEWPKWSPWLCMERDAKVTVEGPPDSVGHRYDWDGQVVGAGGMSIARRSDQQLDMDLRFIRPFKSLATVRIGPDP